MGKKAVGLPTGWVNRELFHEFVYGTVWALDDSEKGISLHKDRLVEGLAVEPTHKKAPFAALKDKKLGDLLWVVDILRIGRPRDVLMAGKILEKMMLFSDIAKQQHEQ